jgi:hypothetical protein
MIIPVIDIYPADRRFPVSKFSLTGGPVQHQLPRAQFLDRRIAL